MTCSWRVFLSPFRLHLPLLSLLGVNGPEAAFFTRQDARDNCALNKRSYPKIRVTCNYNGEPFTVADYAPRTRPPRLSR